MQPRDSGHLHSYSRTFSKHEPEERMKVYVCEHAMSEKRRRIKNCSRLVSSRAMFHTVLFHTHKCTCIAVTLQAMSVSIHAESFASLFSSLSSFHIFYICLLSHLVPQFTFLFLQTFFALLVFFSALTS